MHIFREDTAYQDDPDYKLFLSKLIPNTSKGGGNEIIIKLVCITTYGLQIFPVFM